MPSGQKWGGGEFALYYEGRDDYTDNLETILSGERHRALGGADLHALLGCVLHCALCGHLQRCQMPDIENSRKTAEKGAEWVTVKQPKNSRNTRKTAVLTVFRVFRLFFWLFLGCFTVTHSAPFSAVFRLFSMLGIWHLCRWPQRAQCKKTSF